MPPVFSRLAPVEIPVDFSWTRKMYHLTYAGHLSVEAVLNRVRQVTSTPLVGYSIVHEDTTEYADDGTEMVEGYKHTHVALIFATALHLKGARKFDVVIDDEDTNELRVVHPHVQPTVTMGQMEVIFTQYHAGRKYNMETGKTDFKAPVMHVYHLPAQFDFNQAVMQEVIEAPTLVDACIAGQVRCRSVSDVEKIRASSKDTKKFRHMFDPASFTLTEPAHWNVLHVYGPSGVGKTKWGVSRFKNPFLAKPFDSIGCLESLMRFDPSVHDGIVLDEANLSFMTRQQVIALFDPDEDCTLDVRFKSFTLPAGIKKILISNEHPDKLYPPDPHGAIARRVTRVHVTQPTYYTAAPTPSPPPATPVIWMQQMTPMTAPAGRP